MDETFATYRFTHMQAQSVNHVLSVELVCTYKVDSGKKQFGGNIGDTRRTEHESE